jgi:uncharacterized protein
LPKPRSASTPSIEPLAWPTSAHFDADHLDASGWTPHPFRLFLCKIHTRCNLNCDYCYVYNLADQSWKVKPRVMEWPVVERLTQRIREHVEAHEIEKIHIILHGGEPLLCGETYIREFVQRMRSALSGLTEIAFLMQSNGTLLDDDMCRLLLDLGVRVGISLDGSEYANNVHRPYRNGRPSYADVRRGIELLNRPEYRPVYAGLLCVIDVSNDPLETYHELVAHQPPGIDFLFRLGDHSKPPPGKGAVQNTAYADWLIPIFDHWYSSTPPPTQIRLFQEIIHLIMGGRTGFESIGLNPVTLITIDTGGELEGVDSLKAVFDGAPALAMNIMDESFDDALRHPAVIARQVGRDALHATCRACDIHTVCGGGYYPHRYSDDAGFLNPSVYCADLLKLINYIRTRVRSDVDALLTRAAHPAESA